MIIDVLQDQPSDMSGVEVASAAFDRAAADAVDELHRDGVMGKIVEMPLGTFPGALDASSTPRGDEPARTGRAASSAGWSEEALSPRRTSGRAVNPRRVRAPSQWPRRAPRSR